MIKGLFVDRRWAHAAVKLRLMVAHKRNSSLVRISLDGAAEYPWPDDIVSVRASMSYGRGPFKRATHRASVEASVAELCAPEGVDLELGAYGPFRLSATLAHGLQKRRLSGPSFSVLADHYDIALLGATYPPLLFASLLCKKGGPGSKGPIIAHLQRPSSWKTEYLPARPGFYGMYPIPFLTQEQRMAPVSNWAEEGEREWAHRNAIIDYAAALHKLDPSSTISLYFNDRTPSLIEAIVYANRLEEGGYELIGLSDGDGSYKKFISSYGKKTDPDTLHSARLEEWAEIKEKARAKRATCSFNDQEKYIGNYSSKFLWAALDSEPDAKWLLEDPSELGRIIDEKTWERHPLNSGQLVRLVVAEGSGASEGSPVSLEELYGPIPELSSDDLVVMGTYAPGESDLEDYLRFSIAWFKPEGRVFYKGHPASPLRKRPDTRKLLEGYGLCELDESFPGELLLCSKELPLFAGYRSSSSKAICRAARCAVFQTSGLDHDEELIADAEWTMAPLGESCPPEAQRLGAELGAAHVIRFSDPVAQERGARWGLWIGREGTARLFDASWEDTERTVNF